MKQFEYKFASPEATINELNELGVQGWEAITCDDKCIFLKRELDQEQVRNDVTIEDVLHDIACGKLKVSARIKYALHKAQFDGKTYLRDVKRPRRNFGKKSQTELHEVIEHYKTSTK